MILTTSTLAGSKKNALSAAKLEANRPLWELAKVAMASCDPEFAEKVLIRTIPSSLCLPSSLC